MRQQRSFRGPSRTAIPSLGLMSPASQSVYSRGLLCILPARNARVCAIRSNSGVSWPHCQSPVAMLPSYIPASISLRALTMPIQSLLSALLIVAKCIRATPLNTTHLEPRQAVLYANLHGGSHCDGTAFAVTSANFKDLYSKYPNCANLGNKYHSIEFRRSDGAFYAQADCQEKVASTAVGKCDVFPNGGPIMSISFAGVRRPQGRAIDDD